MRVCTCGEKAEWTYMPSEGDYCNACVPRGCSCNVDPDTGVEDTDLTGRLLPCVEFEELNAGDHE